MGSREVPKVLLSVSGAVLGVPDSVDGTSEGRELGRELEGSRGGPSDGGPRRTLRSRVRVEPRRGVSRKTGYRAGSRGRE